jgi:hypothetical protein
MDPVQSTVDVLPPLSYRIPNFTSVVQSFNKFYGVETINIRLILASFSSKISNYLEGSFALPSENICTQNSVFVHNFKLQVKALPTLSLSRTNINKASRVSSNNALTRAKGINNHVSHTNLQFLLVSYHHVPPIPAPHILFPTHTRFLRAPM